MDPWYSKITTDWGTTISGAAACMYRLKKEGGPIAVAAKIMDATRQDTLQQIAALFNFVPKRSTR